MKSHVTILWLQLKQADPDGYTPGELNHEYSSMIVGIDCNGNCFPLVTITGYRLFTRFWLHTVSYSEVFTRAAGQQTGSFDLTSHITEFSF